MFKHIKLSLVLACLLCVSYHDNTCRIHNPVTICILYPSKLYPVDFFFWLDDYLNIMFYILGKTGTSYDLVHRAEFICFINSSFWVYGPSTHAVNITFFHLNGSTAIDHCIF